LLSKWVAEAVTQGTINVERRRATSSTLDGEDAPLTIFLLHIVISG